MKPLTGFLLLAGVAVGVGVAIAIENKSSSPPPKPGPPPNPLRNVTNRSTTYQLGYVANGTTIKVNVGDRVQTTLRILSPGIDWSLQSSTPSVVGPDPDAVHAIFPNAPPRSPDASDWWLANAPGTAVISGKQVGGQGSFSLTVDVA